MNSLSSCAGAFSAAGAGTGSGTNTAATAGSEALAALLAFSGRSTRRRSSLKSSSRMPESTGSGSAPGRSGAFGRSFLFQARAREFPQRPSSCRTRCRAQGGDALPRPNSAPSGDKPGQALQRFGQMRHGQIVGRAEGGNFRIAHEANEAMSVSQEMLNDSSMAMRNTKNHSRNEPTGLKKIREKAESHCPARPPP